MKRIVITEEQAKKLVKRLVIEQNEPPKEPTEGSYQIYQINSRKYAKIGDDELYYAKYDENEGAWVPDTSQKIAASVKFTVVRDEAGEIRFDIAGGPEYIKDEETRRSFNEGGLQSNARGGQQPMQVVAEPNDITFGWQPRGIGVSQKKMRIVSLGYGKDVDDNLRTILVGEIVPIYATIALRFSSKRPTNTKTGEKLELVNLEEGAELIAEKTCMYAKDADMGRGYFYIKIGETIVGKPVPASGRPQGKLNKAYFCFEMENGSRKIQYAEYPSSEPPPKPESYIGRNGIKGATGPYQTAEEAQKNCQVVKLPQIIPLGKYFADNVSIAKLSKSDEGIKSLEEFFAAGGKLTGFRIIASASMVPAGCEEAQTKQVKNKKGEDVTVCATQRWKDVTKYDSSAKGDNDDGTGNLQLTKARAFNLYKQLLNMFPQLEGIPYSLEAQGSTGLPYDRTKDTPDDPKYAEFRKVNFYPTFNK